MKKVITISVVFVCCVVVLCINGSLSGKNNIGSTDLSKLLRANEANAECWPWETGKQNGLCHADECFPALPGDEECDPSRL